MGAPPVSWRNASSPPARGSRWTVDQPRDRVAPSSLVLITVTVAMAQPVTRLVASLRGAVEPLVHTPQPVQSERIGGYLGAAHGRALRSPLGDCGIAVARRGRPVVVVNRSRPLLLLGDRDIEVEVEVAAKRRRPRKIPPHPPLEALQLRERCPRYRPEHHIVVGEVHGEPVKAVRDRRAGRTAGGVVGPGHEMVDEELRAPAEEIGQRGAPLIGIEPVLFVDRDPGQLLPPPPELVAASREFLLRLEQFEPRRKPLFACPSLVSWHRCFLRCHKPFLSTRI